MKTPNPESVDEVIFVKIDGADLEIQHYNGADGINTPTLVFLHEGLGSVAMWHDFPSRLSLATDRPAMVYSRRGYGRSAMRAGPYGVDFMHHEADHVLPRLLSALNIEMPILIGHSDGASIALIHAANHPVTGIVVEAPHLFVEKIGVDSIADIKETFANSDMVRKLGRYHDDPAHAFQGWTDIWLDPAFMQWTINDCVARVRCPVLAIQGEGDQYGTMAQIDGISSVAQGPVEVFQLPDCGHSPHRDQTEAVLRHMTIFIKKLGAPDERHSR